MRTQHIGLDTRFVVEEAAHGLRRHLAMTVAVVVTVAVSLGLLGAALLVNSQVEALKGYWYDKVEVSVFLCGPTSEPTSCPTGGVTAAERTAVRATLEELPVTDKLYYESSQEAFDRFSDQYAGSRVVGEIDPSTLPESFRVKMTDATRFADVAAAVADLPGVESVSDQRALLERFFAVVGGLQLAALVLAATQVLVAAILVANTVRTAVFVRRREVAIMRLVGASSAMVRAPFLAEGAVAGLLGAVVACGALAAVKAFLIDGKLAESSSYLRYISWGDYWTTVPMLVVLGVALSTGSAALALRKHLRD